MLALIARNTCEFSASHESEADSELCFASVDNPSLIDQEVISKIATTARSESVREMAVRKIADRAFIKQLALESPYEDVRTAAVTRITDQELLAKIAMEDQAKAPRRQAVKELTLQAVLAKVVFEEPVEDIRKLAIEKVTDPYLRYRYCDDCRFEDIGLLKDSDPRLKRIAGDFQEPNEGATNCLARMKLVIREPVVQTRLAGLRCVAEIRRSSQGYASGGPTAAVVYGEIVTIKFQRNGATLAALTWKTDFSAEIDSRRGYTTKHAETHGQDLLSILFQMPAFSRDDLGVLAASTIPEVRIGAVANIADPTLLARMAIGDKSAWVRRAAVGRVTDQAVLGEVAAKDSDQMVRLPAIDRLTDPVLLANLARTGTDRSHAQRRLDSLSPIRQ
jgi:hypothetical protein